MTVKKSYQVGDTVWIYGINRNNTKPTQGKVIKIIDLSDAGYSVGDHYVVEIPTHIEPLLEIRTWHNISQDSKGPIGSFREIGNIEPTIKFARTAGFVFDDDPSLDTDLDDEISPDKILAALEKGQLDISHKPLNLKSNKRRFSKRKPKND